MILPVVPLASGTADPAAAPSTKNCTFPVGVPPVTIALTVRVSVVFNFVADTVRCVVVAVVPPPPPPPPLHAAEPQKPRQWAYGIRMTGSLSMAD